MANDQNGLNVDGKIQDSASTSKSEEKKESSDMNGKKEENENGKEDEKAKTVPIFKLFSFADFTDILLMIAGTIGAIGNGLSTPLMALLFGQILNSFGQNQHDKNIVHSVSMISLKFVYLALGTSAVAFLR